MLQEVSKNYAIVICETKEDFEKLRIADEKQKDMEVKMVFQDEYYCPRCGKENICQNGKVVHKYCPECGQKIYQRKRGENR